MGGLVEGGEGPVAQRAAAVPGGGPALAHTARVCVPESGSKDSQAVSIASWCVNIAS